MTLIPAKLAGRCSNGAERDQGTKIHALGDWDYAQYPHGHHGKSLCGQEPGRRSVGWVERFDRVISCPRCLKRMGHA